MSYLDLTIKEIHEALLQEKVTPKQLVEEALKRAKEDNNNAFEYICEKEALQDLESLHNKDKNNLFWGIPFSIKDNYSTKDIPTCASSNILEGYCPVFDATVVKKLKDAGAILIGKTTMDELAMGGSGTTGHLGITFNPWDPSHTHQVGGSSAGSAANVAASIVPFSIGSDTGDSVRKPASFAGLVGFKPTWGRISRFGLFPFAPSMDHVGFFSRSVEDSYEILKLLSGRDNQDMTTLNNEIKVEMNKSIKGKKVAVIKNIVDSIKDQSIVTAFNKTIEHLKSVGVIVDYIDMEEKVLKAVYPTYIIISCAEAGSNNANLDGIKFGLREKGNSYEEVMINTRSKGFCEMIKRRFIIGSYSLLKENQDELFFKAQKCRHLIVNKINEIFADYDAIYCPAAPSVAPTFSASSSDKLSNEYLFADNWMAIGNFAGIPSLTLPIGFESNLPFGANINAKAGDEETVLLLAKAVEEFTGYYNLSAKGGK